MVLEWNDEMSIELLSILALIILGFSVIIYFIQKQKPSSEILEWLKSTNDRLDSQNKNIVTTLQSTTRDFNERLDNAAKYIGAVQKNIGELSEIGRGMKDLQDFLKSPKLRGNIGEQVLKEILSQILPKQSFHLQYVFKSGVKVDAAIESVNGIIPIDSKFPMENFRKIIDSNNEQDKKKATGDFERDVKKHMDDISGKYILPEEGTIDYALMYIPSEAVYYEIVNNPSLFDYASRMRILPVSPMTFYAYLKAILMSFEGQKIEKQAKEMLKILRAIHKDYEKTDENLTVLQKHITNAYNQLNNVTRSFDNLGQKLSATGTMNSSIEEKEQLKLDKEE
jgi:DNA recombination protein RmuC